MGMSRTGTDRIIVCSFSNNFLNFGGYAHETRSFRLSDLGARSAGCSKHYCRRYARRRLRAPLAVQTVETSFGNEDGIGDPEGGELDAAYAKVWNGRLYLMLTGNLEIDTFNKMEVFFDSKAGGENVLSATPDYDFDSGGGNWISSNLGGLTFDSGFEADYHLFARNNFEVDFIDRAGGGSATVPGASGGATVNNGASPGAIASGTIAAGTLGPNASGSSLTQDLEFALNNTNTLGVLGGSGAADQVAAAAVTTGLEFSIDLADLGNPAVGDVIQISAMYGNGDHNFLSNQILGGVPAPQGNLGGDGSGNFTGNLAGINFNNFAGAQFFRVPVTNEIPEPSSVALVLGAGRRCGLLASQVVVISCSKP